jgi:hypothetical protein
MSDREAMKLALKALEYYQHRRLEWDYADEQAITALRARLAAPRPEPVLPEVISLPESAQAEILEQIRKEVQP